MGKDASLTHPETGPLMPVVLPPKSSSQIWSLLRHNYSWALCCWTLFEQTSKKTKAECSLFRALKKSLYKPGAFFKGIIFPMLDVDRFTLFISSNLTVNSKVVHWKKPLSLPQFLQRTKIPVLHASAALLRIAEWIIRVRAMCCYRLYLLKAGSRPSSLFIRVW